MSPHWQNNHHTRHANTRQWRQLRAKILERDRHRCVECGRPATEVDHIINRARGGAELDPRNLQSLCTDCHRRKTAREAAAGRTPLRRPPERHPGLK